MEGPGFLTCLVVVSKLMKPMDPADWAAKQSLKAPAHQLFLKTLEPVKKTYPGISACRNIMLLVGNRPANASFDIDST
jgi:hypothetical protein